MTKTTSRMRLIGAVGLLILVVSSRSLSAQGYTESDQFEKKHRDPAGKPCLATNGVSRATASNPRILVHSVSLDNHCSNRIKAKVCYYKSDECSDVEVPGNGVKEQVIGVFPAMQMFRYEVREQF